MSIETVNKINPEWLEKFSLEESEAWLNAGMLCPQGPSKAFFLQVEGIEPDDENILWKPFGKRSLVELYSDGEWTIDEVLLAYHYLCEIWKHGL